MGRALSSKGFTLIEVLVAVVFVAIVIALAGPAFARAHRQDRVELCAGHLRTLHAAQQSHYGMPGSPAPELGAAYWVNLAKTTPPLIEPGILLCPVDPDLPGPPIRYLGPAVDPRTLVKDEPMGCDFGGNHSDHGQEGGNILLRSGSVVIDNSRDQGGLWATAVSKACRP